MTISRPSLPPPGSKPHTTVFLPGHGLLKAQHALNRYVITRLVQPRPSTGCTGGYDVDIRIVKRNNAVVRMSATRCGFTTSGRIGGNLPGFRRAVGVGAP